MEMAANGTIVSSGNININGTKTENADEAMIFIFDKIDSKYFQQAMLMNSSRIILLKK